VLRRRAGYRTCRCRGALPSGSAGAQACCKPPRGEGGSLEGLDTSTDAPLHTTNHPLVCLVFLLPRLARSHASLPRRQAG
jgi:hypothetical protein